MANGEAAKLRQHNAFYSLTADSLKGEWRKEIFKSTELHFLGLGIIGMARDLANYEGGAITETRIRRRFWFFDAAENVEIGKEFQSVMSGYKVTLHYDNGNGFEGLTVSHEDGGGEEKIVVSVSMGQALAGTTVFFYCPSTPDANCAKALAVEYYNLRYNEKAVMEGIGEDITDHTLRGWATRFLLDAALIPDKHLEVLRTDFQKMKSAVEEEKGRELKRGFRHPTRGSDWK